MKKGRLFGLMLVVILGASLIAGCSSAPKTDGTANNDDKTFVVGLDDSFPPRGFRDDKE